MMTVLRIGLCLTLVFVLSACANEALKVYEESTYGPPLEVPPDLTVPSKDRGMEIPSLPDTADTNKTGRQGPAAYPKVAPQVEGVKVMRDGALSWLLIKGEPEQIWPWVRDFFLDEGFFLELEDPTMGIVETAWKQQRKVMPEDIKQIVVDDDEILKVFGVPLREKYRIRLERIGDGTTEIFLSHRGARLLRDDDDIVWQLQAADPELEAQMRKSLLMYLGMAQEKAEGMLATALRTKLTSIVTDADGNKILRVDQDFQRAWRRVGVALDHMKLMITDRDRSNGTYFVKTIEPVASDEDKGWFSNLFSGDAALGEYEVVLHDEGESVNILVRDKNKKLVKASIAEPILQQLSELLE